MKLSSIILAVFVSVTCTSVGAKRFVPRGEEAGIVDFLKKTVDNVGDLLSRNGWEYVIIPAMSHHYWTASIWTGKGKVGKFSTMALKGNDQFFTKTRVQNSNIYNFDVQLRLDKLIVHYLYEYSEMFISKASGELQLISKNNTARAKGVINISDNGRCRIVIESIVLSNRNQYEMNYFPQDVSRSVRDALRDFSERTILPQFLNAVNRELEGVLKYVDESKALCESLAPYKLLKTEV